MMSQAVVAVNDCHSVSHTLTEWQAPPSWALVARFKTRDLHGIPPRHATCWWTARKGGVHHGNVPDDYADEYFDLCCGGYRLQGLCREGVSKGLSPAGTACRGSCA